MSKTDKPVVMDSIAKIRKETKTAEVYRLGLSGGKVITFPDFYAMDSEESEKVIKAINERGADGNWGALSGWLSEDDLVALKAEKLSVIELVRVISLATQHYETFYGTPGE